jgi:hypothetical protein
MNTVSNLLHWSNEMPLTLIATEGLIPPSRYASTVSRLSELFLRLHGLAGNRALTPNVVGHVQTVPAGSSLCGLESRPVVVIEWLTPSFAFTSRDVQRAYVKEATDIVEEACEGRQPREHIWVNVKHAVDGTWGIGGEAMTNAELLDAISKG